MLIRRLNLTNFLSFGPESTPIELGALNVLIGPNGSGKSNLIEAMGLLQWAPRELAFPVREGGGIREWLFKGAEPGMGATLETVVEYPDRYQSLHYRLDFTERAQRFELTNELIEETGEGNFVHFGYENGRAQLASPDARREVRREDLHPEQSILSQRKDPDLYPALSYLGEKFSQIRIFRDWSFGRGAAARLPQKADLPNDFLAEDTRNLGMVLNRLRREPAVKKKLLEELSTLYENIDDFDVIIEGGTVQVVLQEGRFSVPAARLSDGTLRYLCLLTILCHPSPPPLICIEEPELGLHPDALPRLAGLLREASERTQLIITTHSDILIDALTETPEVVVVSEKQDGATSMRRLERCELAEWLKKYSLGHLWTRGDLGGTRW